MISKIRYGIPLLVLITGVCGLIYLTGHQNLRMSANDPQIQIAEDIANSLTTAYNPERFVPATKVDIATSLGLYIIIYDNQGQPIVSSAELNGNIPVVPPGVFEYVKQYGEDRVTWQPREGVRSAIVVTRFGGEKSGYVLVGRSLREIEKRETQLLVQVIIGWVTTLIATMITLLIVSASAKTKRD